MDYHERLKQLNTLKTKTVWDCIDRPIRPLIFELHRIGLPTKFSCCGFSYENEEEPKTHAKGTFVVLHRPPKAESLNNFFALCSISCANGWKMFPYNPNGEWHLNIGFNDNFYDRKGEIGIHDYELPLIHIMRLTQDLSRLPSVLEEFDIIDGNSFYNALGGEWQIKPKRSVNSTEISKEVK